MLYGKLVFRYKSDIRIAELQTFQCFPMIDVVGFSQGIRPAAYDKVEEPEIKEIIDRCIRFKRGERYSVKDLLALEFFLEDNVVRVEFVKKESDFHSTDPKILLRVRVPETRATKLKYRENEAIQFEFDIVAESAESVAQVCIAYQNTLERKTTYKI